MSVVAAVRSSHVPAEHFSSSSETDRVRPSSRSVQSSHARFVGPLVTCVTRLNAVSGAVRFENTGGAGTHRKQDRTGSKTEEDRHRTERSAPLARKPTADSAVSRALGPQHAPFGIGSSMTQRTRPVPVWSGVFPRSFSADVDAELCSVEEVLVAVLIVHDPRLGLLLARCLAAWDSSRDPRHSALASHWVLA